MATESTGTGNGVEVDERIPLYPGQAPGTEDWTHEERAYFSTLFNTEVVTNVSRPSLEVFPAEQPNGAAVVIAPGGGFHALSINSEGNDVARWLNARGVTAFVQRYRLVPGGGLHRRRRRERQVR